MVGSLIAGIGLGSRVAAIILFGLVFTGFPMLLGMAIAWPSAPLLQVPISLLTAAMGYYLARHGGDMGRGSKRGSSQNSDWTWGGFGGIPSSGGSWSSGGGGFSQDWGGFGGGSSGGGGASSSW
jgi:hypothetical protein